MKYCIHVGKFLIYPTCNCEDIKNHQNGMKNKHFIYKKQKTPSSASYGVLLLIGFLIGTKNINLQRTINCTFLPSLVSVGEWAKQTSHKLQILSSRLVFFSINQFTTRYHIQWNLSNPTHQGTREMYRGKLRFSF